eukprot:1693361-Rhodomonas_salina.4
MLGMVGGGRTLSQSMGHKHVVQWAALKPSIRAVEKAVYEYKGDVSMVLCFLDPVARCVAQLLRAVAVRAAAVCLAAQWR